jgi:hypothetical protein
MACTKKQNTGSCSHYQCPFKDQTEHGYECVDIYTEYVNKWLIGFCECGEGCISDCSYSWKNGDNSLKEQAAKQFVNSSI